MRNGRINMIVDNLPAATKFLDQDQNTVYSLGFPLGFVGSTEVRVAALGSTCANPLSPFCDLAL
eukprot:SAG31_NODE_6707_length_1917_cov_1.268427_3_plen_64_part_00